MPQPNAAAWVTQHYDAIAETMRIIKAGPLGDSLYNAGTNVLGRASVERLDTLSSNQRLELTALLTGMGFFAGMPTPDNEVADHKLALGMPFDRMVDVFRHLVGQDFVCITSSRMRSESVDGSTAKFAELEQRFAHTEWWRWASSPQALHAHDWQFGRAALAMLVASDGTCDLSGVTPQDLRETKQTHPDRIQLSGTPGEMTILPHGSVQYPVLNDLKHWLHLQTLHRFPLQPGTIIHIATHALSVVRIGCRVAQTILRAQPDCHVTVVAAPVPEADRHDLTTVTLTELAQLLSLASK